LGAVSIVIPPWNGFFGKYLRAQKAAAENQLESSVTPAQSDVPTANDQSH